MRGPAESSTSGAHEQPTPASAGTAANTVATLPSFFIAGHEKCGTTALYRILRSHPQIYMPELKEPRYFMRDPDDEPKRAGVGVLPRTLDAYLALFAGARAGQLAGEASPQYLRSAKAPLRIAEFQPGARVIAILREPVSFLRSFHLACVRSGLETELDLGKALELEAQRRQGRQIPRGCRAPEWLWYSDHVRYVEQLRRFEDALSPEQVHVIIYEDLRRDNERVARDALRFLGVDETLAIDVTDGAGHSRKAVRSLPMHRLGIAIKRARRGEPAPALARGLASALPAWLERAMRRAVYAPPRPLDEHLAVDLRGRFEPEVAALADHIGRDLLGEWGYRG